MLRSPILGTELLGSPGDRLEGKFLSAMDIIGEVAGRGSKVSRILSARAGAMFFSRKLPIKDASGILTKGGHNSSRVLVADLAWPARKGEGSGRGSKTARGLERRERARAATTTITNRQCSRGSANLVKYAPIYQWRCISIATTANWHDYNASQLLGCWRTRRGIERGGEKDEGGPRMGPTFALGRNVAWAQRACCSIGIY